MTVHSQQMRSDAELWLDAARGDDDSFGLLVERYRTLIRSLAYRRTGDPATAEDLAQETFLAAWRQLGDLRQPHKLRAWLCGITRLLSLHAGPRPIPLSEADPPTLQPNPEQHAAANQLWDTLDRLPPPYRDPLILHYRDGEPIANVAVLLGITIDAAKQRLSRGRALLRAELGPRAYAVPFLSNAVPLGAVAGLAIALLAAKLACLSARTEPERAAIAHAFHSAIGFTFAMIGVLLAVIFWLRDPRWIAAAGFAWTAILLARLLTFGNTLHRPDSPGQLWQTRARLGGIPLIAFASGGLDVTARQRTAVAWIAVGDTAISPLFAAGGLAVAPIAVGGAAVGIIAIAPLALGVWALGCLAAGWIAAGPVAVGWHGAWGGVAIARDFALGGAVSAHEANTAAALAWARAEWWLGPFGFLLRQAWWVLVLTIVIPLAGMARRARKAVSQ